MRMTDTIRVKEEGDTMKCSEAEIKDNTAVEHFVRSESQEQIQAEKVEKCTDNKNDVQVREMSPILFFHPGVYIEWKQGKQCRPLWTKGRIKIVTNK